MIDHSARVYARLRHDHQKTMLSTEQAMKLESQMARSYTDDADFSHGAMSAPRIHFRPGQRDDAVSPGFVGMMPIL